MLPFQIRGVGEKVVKRIALDKVLGGTGENWSAVLPLGFIHYLNLSIQLVIPAILLAGHPTRLSL